MAHIEVSTTDESALLKTGHLKFVYSRKLHLHQKQAEFDDFVFIVTKHNRIIFDASYSDMSKQFHNIPGMYELQDCLLFCIGIYLNK